MVSKLPETEHLDGVVWWRFADQSRFGHAVAAVGGLAVWVGAYLFWLDVMLGDLSLVVADSPSAIDARQEAMMMATVACYVWFSVAFMLGKGGPSLNLIVYPLVFMALGPFVPSLALAGWIPGQYSTGSTFASPTLIADTITMFLPGFVVGSGLVVGFLLTSFYLTGTGPEWEARHMPEAWHKHKRQARAEMGDDSNGDVSTGGDSGRNPD